MKKSFWLRWAGVCIGLCMVVLFYRLQEQEKKNQSKINKKNLQPVFSNLEKKGMGLVEKLSTQSGLDTLILPYNQPHLFNKIRNIENSEQFYVYILDHEHKLVAWNTNEYLPTNAEFDTQIELKKPVTTHKKNFVYYSMVEEIKKQQDVVGYVFVLIPLAKKYSIENRYIQPSSIFDGFANTEYDLVADIKNLNAIPIYNSNKEYVTSVQVKPKSNYVSEHQKYFVLSVFIAFGLFLFAIHHTLKEVLNSRKLVTFIFTLIVVLLRYLMIAYHFPQKFYAIPLFSPAYYAANNWNTSLGDLLINATLGLILTFEWYYSFLQKYTIREHISKKNTLTVFWVVGIYVIFATGTYLYQNIVHSVVTHSNIRFDFTNTLQIDEYIAIAILALMLIFICFFLIQYWLVGFWILLYKKRNALLLLLIHVVITAINIPFKFVQGYLLWFIIPIYFILLSYIRYHTEYKQKLFFAFNHSLGLVFVFGLILASHIHYFWGEKQNQEQIQFALRKAKQHDEILESVYNEVSNQVKKDEFIQRFITDTTAYNPALIQKIERFVTNATQYYNCDIAITDEKNKVLYYPKKTPLRINEETLLKNEYHITNELYLIPYNREFIENLYVAIIPFNQNGITRKIHIEFVPNTIYRNGLYPNLLVDKKQYKLLQGALRYSYAVYQRNELVNMQGNFNYDFQNTILKNPLPEQKGKWVKVKNAKHYVYSPAKEKVIIVTRTLPNIFDFFTLTSYMIYAWTIIFILLSLPYWIRHYSKRKNLQFNLYYRTKIQLYLLFMSLIPLLVIGAVSIPFIKKSYYEEVQRELKRQTQAVLTAIHARGFSEADFTQSSNALQSLTSDIAILTQSDVNLYSKQGKLVVSTQPKIFELGLLSNNIHANAYYYLNMQYQQEFIQNEKIGNLSYISIYVPVIDKNLNMLGILNMPYITRQGQLEAEVARFVSYLIGVYVVILLGLAGLTLLLSNTLTKPLNVLKQRIEQIRLGKKNELMQWKSNDEIGALVQAYNQMVEKLEASERKLAISEREAAWREMARQIAHEIKNPLTPMKLSIQHLLRAHQDNHPNLNMMIEKVSKTLLTEIESLTEIATAFSNFAKLQQQEPELIEVQALLKQNIALYQSHEDIIFDIQLPETPYFIYADHSAVSRTFQNIIKNAIQAMESSDTKILSIQLYKENSQIYVSIKDTGCGIDKEHLERIFEPNFTTKSSGTGLGLAISKRAIENANGNIYVQSKVGKGTTFMVVLPEHDVSS
jgi:signal transduction histidine kinase